MTKQEILEKLKESWLQCRKDEKDPEHQKRYPGFAYSYGSIMETIRHILYECGVWNDQKNT